MNRLKAITIASCLFLLAVAFLPSSKADEWNKKTIITINEPLAIPGKVLQPGTYVMKLLDSPADRHIVQIFNQDESQIQATILAMPNYKLEPSDKTQFAFWEMPAGQPRALKAWFYPGDNFGQEFAYPKELATTIAQTNNQNVPVEENSQIAGVTTPSGQTQPLTNENCNCQQPNNATVQNQTASSQANTSTSTMANNQPVTPPEQPPEQPQAQSNAAATQPAPSTAETQPSASASANAGVSTPPENQTAANTNAGRTLPRTASPYPLAGFIGLLSAGAALAVRRARRA